MPRPGDAHARAAFEDERVKTSNLKIIGAGLPRTGTSSLKAALDRLGFGPTYHMFELMQHPEHLERWRPVMNRESSDWDKVFAGYHSAVDFPASIYWREMAEAYPDAKVILTVRDPRRWHESIRGMGPQAPIDGDLDMAAVLERMPEQMRKFGDLMTLTNDAAQRMLGDDFGLGGQMDEETSVELFERHVENVRSALPEDRLLVFQASDGWAPLCEFLGVEAPVDEPYPHLNDAKTLQRIFATLMESNELVSPFEPTK
jgi:hypothetical protein